jgi:ubiquinone/menaquinone biosynthesis C-methylase UbiE
MKPKSVYNYYKMFGWKKLNGIHRDTLVNENLQQAAIQYNKDTKRRIWHELQNLPGERRDSILDCASGPIQYPEYLEYSRLFKKRICIDFSEAALQAAEVNLLNDGQHGSVFHCSDFLDLEIEDNSYDASISLHTLYHVNLLNQKQFVEKLIAVTKPGGLVVIVYSNPYSLRSIIRIPSAVIRRIWASTKLLLSGKSNIDEAKIYCKRNPRRWWKQFERYGSLSMKPYRIFTPPFETFCIPDNKVGVFIYKLLFKIEGYSLSNYISDYYMIILKKSL